MNALQVTALLVVGYIAFALDRWQKHFPLPVFLVSVGIALSFTPFFSDIHITKDIIYDVFLPGLLFISAYQYSAASLKKHWKVIGTLSTIGLIAAALLLGITVYWIGGYFIGISYLGALLFASILTPTDPVSVVSILKQSSDDPSIADVVDGESMINDGTSIVLFTVLLNMFSHHTSFHLLDFLKDFFYVSLGGVSLGILFGWICSKAIHISPQKENQVLLSIVIAYGVFHLAEQFGFSGVLATVSAGIMLSAEIEKHTELEKSYRKSLDGFWEVAEPALLSILFLLIGIEAAEYVMYSHWLIAITIFLVSICIRFLVIAGIMRIFDGFRQSVNMKNAFLLSWSGIRGTMSVFLLLTLQTESGEAASELASLGFTVVLLSLFIQSIGIYPFTKWLKS